MINVVDITKYIENEWFICYNLNNQFYRYQQYINIGLGLMSVDSLIKEDFID